MWNIMMSTTLVLLHLQNRACQVSLRFSPADSYPGPKSHRAAD